MARLATFALGLVSLAGLAATGWLASDLRGDTAARYQSAIEIVHTTEGLVGEWIAEVRALREHRDRDFDALAAYVPQVRAEQRKLREALDAISARPRPLDAEANAYAAGLSGLRERIEEIKTSFAVVRNSERYLPITAEQATRAARHAGRDALANQIAELLRGLDRYRNAPSDVAQRRLAQAVEKLRVPTEPRSTALDEAVGEITGHANALLTHYEPTQTRFREVLDNNRTAASKRIIDHLENAKRNAETDLQNRTIHTLGAGGGTLVALALTVVMVRRRREDALRARPTVAEAAPAIGDPHLDELAREAELEVAAARAEGIEEEPGDEEVRTLAAALAADAEAGIEPEDVATEREALRQTLQHGAEPAPGAAAPGQRRAPSPPERAVGAAQARWQRRAERHGLALASTAQTLQWVAEQLGADPQRFDAATVHATLSTLAARLALLARPMEQEMPALTAIAPCIEEACAEHAHGPIRIESSDEGGEAVLGRPSAITGAISALIENAVDAHRRNASRDPHVRVSAGERNARRYIEIVDDAGGIAPARIEKARRAWVSEDPAHHAGLGLACAGALAGEAGAQIRIESLHGHGTLATIEWPPRHDSPHRAPGPEPDPEGRDEAADIDALDTIMREAKLREGVEHPDEGAAEASQDQAGAGTEPTPEIQGATARERTPPEDGATPPAPPPKPAPPPRAPAPRAERATPPAATREAPASAPHAVRPGPATPAPGRRTAPHARRPGAPAPGAGTALAPHAERPPGDDAPAPRAPHAAAPGETHPPAQAARATRAPHARPPSAAEHDAETRELEHALADLDSASAPAGDAPGRAPPPPGAPAGDGNAPSTGEDDDLRTDLERMLGLADEAPDTEPAPPAPPERAARAPLIRQ